MGLLQDIFLEMQNGNIGPEFSAKELKQNDTDIPGRVRVGNSTYARNYLGAALRGYSICEDGSDPGDYVEKGQAPRFYRLARGRYSLIGNTDLGEYDVPSEEIPGEDLQAIHDDDSEDSTGAFVPYENTSTGCPDPAEIVFNTIRTTPFQKYFRRQRQLHPSTPATGWQDRLNAYFWPKLADDWHANVPKLKAFETNFKLIKFPGGSHVDEAALHQIFEDICTWGGVSMPTVSQPDLYRIVTNALHNIDSGTVPAGTSPLNSAWTKLYAIARPKKVVIYDSRVATALVSILDPYMATCVKSKAFNRYEHLGYVNGRGGSRPRLLTHSWPNGYMNWDAQFAANDLCIEVLALLNKKMPKEDGWTLREVEAVLFMEGY